MMNWIAELTKEALKKANVQGDVNIAGNKLVIRIPAEEVKKAVINSFDPRLRPYVTVHAEDIVVEVLISAAVPM